MIEVSTEIDFSTITNYIAENEQNEKLWKIIFNTFIDSYTSENNEVFLSKVHKHLAQIIDVSNFYVAIYDSNTGTYTFPFFIDEKDEKIIFLNLNLKRSLTDYVRKRGKAILLDKNDDQKLIESGEVDLVGAMAEYWIGIPLKFNNIELGVWVIQSYNAQIVFTKKDLNNLLYLSSFISAVLYNKITYNNLKENLRRYHLAQKVSTFGSFEIDVYNDTWWLSSKTAEILMMKKSEIGKSFLPIRRIMLRFAKFDFDTFFHDFIYNRNEIDFELEWKIRENEARIVRIKAEKFLLNNDRVLKINGIIQDITDQRNYEIQLEEAKERAEESDRLKTAFLSNISHEVRTPMNAIIGFSDLLKEPDITKEETEEYVDLIANSGEILLKLIDDIVDIAKIEAGQLSVCKSKVYINTFFSDLKIFFEKYKIDKQKTHLEIIFENNISLNDDFYIITDEFRLKQIVTNFITNAIKFTEKGFVNCSCNQIADFVEFRIQDTGIGISDENRSIIFKQFGQILNEGRIYQGTGLGLTIARNLIKMLGGEVNFESEIGKGTTFFFTLPFKIVEH